MSKLTLDEAIKHYIDIAESCESEADRCDETDRYECHEKYELGRCATEHRQLAEWLTDYKELKDSIGAVKLSNMKEALALIRTLKAELNGWQEDPFSIITERRCQWYEKCPFRNNYGSYLKDWSSENAE